MTDPFVNKIWKHANGYHEIFSYACNHTAGNLLVVMVWGNSITNYVTGVSDTAGNTYHFAVRKQRSDSVLRFVEIWWAENILGNAANVVTVTYNEDPSGYDNMIVHQYTGCAGSSAFDVSGTGIGDANPQTTNAVAINHANEIIVAIYSNQSGGFKYSAGADFTLRHNGEYFSTEDRVVSSIDSYGSSITDGTSEAWVGAHATFILAAPDPPTGVEATPGNGKATISFYASAGATSYNIYWDTSPGVTKGTGTKIPGVTSPYDHTGRTNGTTYYYVVTAENGMGESSESSEVSATPEEPSWDMKQASMLLMM